MHSKCTATGAEGRALSRGRELTLVSVVYLLLTAILTYPTIARLGSHIPGAGDAPRSVWDIWAFARSIADHQLHLSTTDLIFHPLPNVPAIWTSPANLLLSLPLATTLGPVLTYNLFFLSSFVLAGLFGYLLFRHLSGDKLAALAAGSMFSFSAYHYAHGLGHWNLFSVQWLPLCALCLLRLHAKPDFPRVVQFIVAASLVVLIFPYFGAYFLLPLLVCFFLYQLWRERSRVCRPRFLAGVALALAVAAGGAFLFYGQVLLPGQEMAVAVQEAAKDTERYSADLLAFVLPSASHPLFGDVVAPAYANFGAPASASEMTVYVGIVALLLAIWGLRGRGGTDVAFWALLAVVALVMSLGPVLRVNGETLFPLPYALLMRLPLFGGLRAPARASITVMLAVSVLAGYGLRDLLDRVGDRSIVKAVTVAAVVLLVSFESLLAFPYQSSSVAVPEFYERVLNGPQRAALFELPSGPGRYESTGWYMLYQTYHHRELAHGYLARDPLPVVLFPYWVLRGGLLSPPVMLSESETWAVFEASFRDLLAYNDIRYVVVQRQAGPFAVPYSADEYQWVKASLARSLGQPFYEEDGLVAYEVSPRVAQVRTSLGGKLELADHRLVETTSCPEATGDCTFLVTFWRATGPLPEEYGFYIEFTSHNGERVLAATSHNLGHQFTHGDEVACYNTTWWAPGVVIADYVLLPSTASDGNPLSGALDIRVWVANPKTGVVLDAQSDHYAIDDKGRLLIDSYSD